MHLGKNKKLTIAIFIFVFSLILRVWRLDSFPIGITHDELNYILSAKSLFLTGSFLPRTAPAILPTNMAAYDVVIAEVPAIVLAILIGFLKTSLFNTRIVGAIFSSLVIVLLYLIVEEVTRNIKAAAITGFLASINPWSFLLGRTMFETNFIVFFFLLGLFLLIKGKGKNIFLSLVFFLLGFFSYTGGQLTFYLLIVAFLGLHYFFEKKPKQEARNYVISFFVITFVFLVYIVMVLSNQSIKSRGGELFLPNSKVVSEEVDRKRLLAIPSGINKFFVNKVTVYKNGFIERYLDAFSPNILFVNGEMRAAFSYQEHGNFYLVDFFFVILGFLYLFQKHRKVCILFVTAILISPLTSGLSNVEHSYSQRAALMYPFLIVFAGVGVFSFVDWIKTKRLALPISLFVFLVYFLSFANLTHIYFYRFPVYASDGWFLEDRVLARYINLQEEGFPEDQILVVSSEPKITFEEYLFFGNFYGRDTAKKINENLSSGDFSFKNVSFVSSCPGSVGKNTTLVVDTTLSCKLPPGEDHLRITRLKDVNEKYLIYNDKICGRDLGRYISIDSSENFDIEKLDNDSFCKKWVTRL